VLLKRLADEAQDDEAWEVPLAGTSRKLDFRLPRTTLTYRLQPGKKDSRANRNTGGNLP
jgi:hypothetical protein